MKRLLPLACTALLIAGCAAQQSSRYPSLLPRAIESRSDAEPTPAPAPTAAPDPALDAKLSEKHEILAESARAFGPGADRAEQLAVAAKGDPAGGDRWIAAQTALAQLDAYRADTSGALGDIEQMAIDRAAAGEPDYPAIESIRAEAEAQLNAQAARIARIQAMLPAA